MILNCKAFLNDALVEFHEIEGDKKDAWNQAADWMADVWGRTVNPNARKLAFEIEEGFQSSKETESWMEY